MMGEAHKHATIPQESGVGISYHLVLGPLSWECSHPKALPCGGYIPKMSGVGDTNSTMALS